MVLCVSEHTRALRVSEESRICHGRGHVRGGGTAPFAKLTALDRDPGILYAFLDLRPAILRWIFRRKRSPFDPPISYPHGRASPFIFRA